MYTDSVSCVKVESEMTDWFQLEKGLKQGSASSKFLFVVKMAITVEADVMGDMVFAVDIVVRIMKRIKCKNSWLYG
ncbi:hypothetical protein PR048_001218 [Dryococelus australis]|uniref:Uncharacterized protein n=1 Tax=Dryococelus australis TaxID=614101 RepID=A0ABQ9IGR5_9NEOP|nr:hypothetical protein PR048_001218 [Dryococelus australis]